MQTKAAQKLRERLKPTPKPDIPATQSDLAKKLGVTPQAVSGWLNGHATPSPENMAAIERLFGIPMREWVEGDEAGDAA